jgi:preprotein translocase subunit SecA
VEWDFIEAMLAKLGFNQSFTELVMKCVRSVKYKVRVNNEVMTEIIPERCLRQGDPLSSYLFLICAEGLSALLHQAETNKLIQGIKVCQGTASVTHLLFADDSLILMKADATNVQKLQEILELYEACSGQKVNKDKSSIMFSRNVPSHRREELKQRLQLSTEARTEKYLGLPIYIGRSKQKPFEFLKEKIWKRIQGWREKLLSLASKEILIKAVAQAIPTYAMACFDLTKSFCDQVRAMISQILVEPTRQRQNALATLGFEEETEVCRRNGIQRFVCF